MLKNYFSNAGILKNNNFYDPENLRSSSSCKSISEANHIFEKGRDYIIQDDALKIIDELTGRILEGRRFGDGLHQALEAKEQIDVQAENQTLASITYQITLNFMVKFQAALEQQQQKQRNFMKYII